MNLLKTGTGRKEFHTPIKDKFSQSPINGWLLNISYFWLSLCISFLEVSKQGCKCQIPFINKAELKQVQAVSRIVLYYHSSLSDNLLLQGMDIYYYYRNTGTWNNSNVLSRMSTEAKIMTHTQYTPTLGNCVCWIGRGGVLFFTQACCSMPLCIKSARR